MKSKFNATTLRLSVIITFITCTITQVKAQNCDEPPNCITNPNFSGQSGDLNKNNNQTVAGWFFSHGTPTVQGGQGIGGTNSLWMWSKWEGEGAYTCFNFQKNHTYQICYWVQNTNDERGGNLNIIATTGLDEPTYAPLGGPVPSPTTSEVIDNSFVSNWDIGIGPRWTKEVITYTPTDNFNQLWIYPHLQGAQLYELRISKVNIIEIPDSYSLSVPCDGTIFLEESDQTCATTKWTDPHGKSLGTGSVTITHGDPSMSGTYVMTISVGDCEVSVDIPVQVAECNCDEFTGSFQVSGSSQPIQFTENSTGDGSTVNWFWNFGDGTTSNNPNPTHNYSQGGTYTVCLTALRRTGNQTCCAQVCNEIEVEEPDDETPGGLGGPDLGELTSNISTGFEYKPMGIPHAVKFTETTVVDDFTEYTWNFGDGTSSGRKNPAHIYSKSGTYNVCLIAHRKGYDENGNLIEQGTSEYCDEVKVGPTAYDINQGEVHVMPNPTKNLAYVTVENIPNPQVILRNMAGVEVTKGEIGNPNQYIVNLDGLPEGIYIVEVKSEYGSKALKLIKE